MRRVLALLAILGSFVLGARCADNSGTSGDASTDGPPDICDLDAFTDAGDPCPFASNRLCFPYCVTGGCRCLDKGKGPRWACVIDNSCDVDCGPIADCGPGDATIPDTSVADTSVPDAADAGASDSATLDASDAGD